MLSIVLYCTVRISRSWLGSSERVSIRRFSVAKLLCLYPYLSSVGRSRPESELEPGLRALFPRTWTLFRALFIPGDSLSSGLSPSLDPHSSLRTGAFGSGDMLRMPLFAFLAPYLALSQTLIHEIIPNFLAALLPTLASVVVLLLARGPFALQDSADGFG